MKRRNFNFDYLLERTVLSEAHGDTVTFFDDEGNEVTGVIDNESPRPAGKAVIQVRGEEYPRTINPDQIKTAETPEPALPVDPISFLDSPEHEVSEPEPEGEEEAPEPEGEEGLGEPLTPEVASEPAEGGATSTFVGGVKGVMLALDAGHITALEVADMITGDPNNTIPDDIFYNSAEIEEKGSAADQRKVQAEKWISIKSQCEDATEYEEKTTELGAPKDSKKVDDKPEGDKPEGDKPEGNKVGGKDTGTPAPGAPGSNINFAPNITVSPTFRDMVRMQDIGHGGGGGGGGGASAPIEAGEGPAGPVEDPPPVLPPVEEPPVEEPLEPLPKPGDIDYPVPSEEPEEEDEEEPVEEPVEEPEEEDEEEKERVKYGLEIDDIERAIKIGKAVATNKRTQFDLAGDEKKLLRRVRDYLRDTGRSSANKPTVPGIGRISAGTAREIINASLIIDDEPIVENSNPMTKLFTVNPTDTTKYMD